MTDINAVLTKMMEEELKRREEEARLLEEQQAQAQAQAQQAVGSIEDLFMPQWNFPMPKEAPKPAPKSEPKPANINEALIQMMNKEMESRAFNKRLESLWPEEIQPMEPQPEAPPLLQSLLAAAKDSERLGPLYAEGAPVHRPEEAAFISQAQPLYNPKIQESLMRGTPIEEGNISLDDRPVIKNKDGSISTLRTISVGFDDGAYLIPTIAPDGTQLTNEEAIELFKETGKHLGKFISTEAADRYARKLSVEQGARYAGIAGGMGDLKDPQGWGKAMTESKSPQADLMRMARHQYQQELGGKKAVEGIVDANTDPESWGNIPRSDGSASALKTKVFDIAGQHHVLPVISQYGDPISDEGALEQYKETGRHFGIYDDKSLADAESKRLGKEFSERKLDSSSIGTRIWDFLNKPIEAPKPVNMGPGMIPVGERREDIKHSWETEHIYDAIHNVMPVFQNLRANEITSTAFTLRDHMYSILEGDDDESGSYYRPEGDLVKDHPYSEIAARYKGAYEKQGLPEGVASIRSMALSPKQRRMVRDLEDAHRAGDTAGIRNAESALRREIDRLDFEAAVKEFYSKENIREYDRGEGWMQYVYGAIENAGFTVASGVRSGIAYKLPFGFILGPAMSIYNTVKESGGETGEAIREFMEANPNASHKEIQRVANEVFAGNMALLSLTNTFGDAMLFGGIWPKVLGSQKFLNMSDGWKKKGVEFLFKNALPVLSDTGSEYIEEFGQEIIQELAMRGDIPFDEAVKMLDLYAAHKAGIHGFTNALFHAGAGLAAGRLTSRARSALSSRFGLRQEATYENLSKDSIGYRQAVQRLIAVSKHVPFIMQHVDQLNQWFASEADMREMPSTGDERADAALRNMRDQGLAAQTAAGLAISDATPADVGQAMDVAGQTVPEGAPTDAAVDAVAPTGEEVAPAAEDVVPRAEAKPAVVEPAAAESASTIDTLSENLSSMGRKSLDAIATTFGVKTDDSMSDDQVRDAIGERMEKTKAKETAGVKKRATIADAVEKLAAAKTDAEVNAALEGLSWSQLESIARKFKMMSSKGEALKSLRDRVAEKVASEMGLRAVPAESAPVQKVTDGKGPLDMADAEVSPKTRRTVDKISQAETAAEIKAAVRGVHGDELLDVAKAVGVEASPGDTKQAVIDRIAEKVLGASPVAAAAGNIRKAKTREEAMGAMDGLIKPQLLELANELGVPAKARDRVGEIRDAIADSVGKTDASDGGADTETRFRTEDDIDYTTEFDDDVSPETIQEPAEKAPEPKKAEPKAKAEAEQAPSETQAPAAEPRAPADTAEGEMDLRHPRTGEKMTPEEASDYIVRTDWKVTGKALVDAVRRVFRGGHVRDYGHGFLEVTTANGKKVFVTLVDSIPISDEQARREGLTKEQQARGGLGAADIVLDGYALVRIAKQGLLIGQSPAEGSRLVRDYLETTFHESGHLMFDFVLTDRERAHLLRKYESEEKAIQAFHEWAGNRATREGQIFGKVYDFYSRMANNFFGPNTRHIFNQMYSGEAWERASRDDVRAPHREWNPFTGKVDVKFAPDTQLRVSPAIRDAVKATSLDRAYEIATQQKYAKNVDFQDKLHDAGAKVMKNLGLDYRDLVNNRNKADPAKVQVLKDYMREALLDDATRALVDNLNAVGWYNEGSHEAMAILATVHPEVIQDPNARFDFSFITAITSNGMRVDNNFALALKIYEKFKETGKMPTDMGVGDAAKAMNNAFAEYNRQIEKFGKDLFKEIMLSKFTVSQLEQLGFRVNGELVGEYVYGAAFFGPKVGNGFMVNLNGIYDALTMDTWFMRAIARHTGTLRTADDVAIEKASDRLMNAVEGVRAGLAETLGLREGDRGYESALDKALSELLNKAIGPRRMADIDLANIDPIALGSAIGRATSSAEARKTLNAVEGGDELRRAGNQLKSLGDKYRDAPFGGGERQFIREVMGEVLEVLRSDPAYRKLTMADLQAVLWYAEKRLYDSAKAGEEMRSYADDEQPNYPAAAIKAIEGRGVSEEAIAEAREIGKEMAKDADAAEDARERIRKENAEEREAGRRPTQKDPGDGKGLYPAKRAELLKREVLLRERLNRAGDGEVRVVERRSNKDDRRLRGIDATLTPTRKYQETLNLSEIESPAFHELTRTDNNAKKFRDAIIAAKETLKFGSSVWVYDQAEYADMKLFLSEDGLAGFAIKDDGDVVSVFNTDTDKNRQDPTSERNWSGMVHWMMEIAKDQGGTKLDCFDTVLPIFYALSGFQEVGRATWDDQYKPADWSKEDYEKFNNGEPDIVFMERNDSYDPTQESWFKEQSHTKYLLAGRTSEGYAIETLYEAEDMFRSGKHSAKEILAKTGWFEGVDGELRYEIDDSKASFTERFTDKYEKYYPKSRVAAALDKHYQDVVYSELTETSPPPDITLGDLLNHEDLYSAYPTLKNVKIIPIRDTASLARRSMPVIELGYLGTSSGPGSLARDNYLKGVLLHEIQHLVQGIEGFATGGSPDTIGKLGQLMYDNYRKGEADLAAGRAREERGGAPLSRGQVERAETLMERGRQGMEALGLGHLLSIKDGFRPTLLELYEGYKRIGGEAEARLVQERMEGVTQDYSTPLEHLKAMLIEEGLMKEAQSLEDVLIPLEDIGGGRVRMGDMWSTSKDAIEALAPGTELETSFRTALEDASYDYDTADAVADTVAGAPSDQVHGTRYQSLDEAPANLKKAAEESRLLDWGKPAQEQSDTVQDVVKMLEDRELAGVLPEDSKGFGDLKGRDVYKALSNSLGSDMMASRVLARMGVEGMHDGKGYVSFSDDGIILDSKYRIAYHGSPHRFDRFDTAYIGTGEGLQAFGWGLYFAGDAGIAEHYRESLAKPSKEVYTPGGRYVLEEGGELVLHKSDGSVVNKSDMSLGESLGIETYIRENGNVATAKTYLENMLQWARSRHEKLSKHIDTERHRATMEGALALLREVGSDMEFRDALPVGQLYEVDIPSDTEYLDLDKPFLDQPEGVQEKALSALTEDSPFYGWLSEDGKALVDKHMPEEVSKGERGLKSLIDAYWEARSEASDKVNDLSSTPDEVARWSDEYRKLDTLVSMLVGMGNNSMSTLLQGLQTLFDSDKAASLYLKNIGIPGLRYLDGLSRREGEGTHNYVVFDDANVEIINTRYRTAPGMMDSDARIDDKAINRSFQGAKGTTLEDGLYLVTMANGNTFAIDGRHMVATDEFISLKSAGRPLVIGNYNASTTRVVDGNLVFALTNSMTNGGGVPASAFGIAKDMVLSDRAIDSLNDLVGSNQAQTEMFDSFLETGTTPDATVTRHFRNLKGFFETARKKMFPGGKAFRDHVQGKFAERLGMAAEGKLTPRAIAAGERKLASDTAEFVKRVGEAVRNGFKGPEFYVTNTPLALILGGVQDAPITISPDTLRKILAEKHGGEITPDMLRDLPRLLADPIMVIKQQDNNYLAMLAMQDANGSTINVPIRLTPAVTPSGVEFSINSIRSLFGRHSLTMGQSNPQWFVERMHEVLQNPRGGYEMALKYLDRNMGRAWGYENGVGTQMANAINNLDMLPGVERLATRADLKRLRGSDETRFRVRRDPQQEWQRALEERGLENIVPPSRQKQTFGEKLAAFGDWWGRKWVDDKSPIRKLLGESVYIDTVNAIDGIYSRAIGLIKFGEAAKGVKPLESILESIPSNEQEGFAHYITYRHLQDIARNSENALADSLLLDDLAKEESAKADAATDRATAKHHREMAAKFKQSAEIARDGIKITKAHADDYEVVVRDMESRYPHWKGSQKDLAKFSRYLLWKLQQSGVITRDLYNHLVSLYPNYVPLQRDLTDEHAIDIFSKSKGIVNISNPLKRLKGSKLDVIDPLYQIVANTAIFEAISGKQKAAQGVVDLVNSGELEGLVKKYEGERLTKDDYVFHIWEDGQRVEYVTGEDIYDAVTLPTQRGKLNPIVQMFNAARKILTGSVVLSFGFIGRNLPKDSFNAGVVGENFIPMVDSLRSMMNLWFQDETFQKFVKAGGIQGLPFLGMSDIEGMLSTLRRQRGLKASAKQMLKHPFRSIYDMLGNISEFGENMTRLGQAKAAVRNGRSWEHAVFLARDLQNFSRGGDMSRMVSRFIPFFNAQIQGLSKMMRAFYHDGKVDVRTVGRALMYVTLPSILATLWNYSDDEKKEVYMNINQWRKNLFWNFVIGSGEDAWVFSVPKPYELGMIFGSSVERLIDLFHGYDEDAFNGFASAMVDAVSPEAIPLVMSGILGSWANYDFFEERPIVPQSEQQLEPWLQYGPYTAKWAQWAGKMMNVSPRKVEHLMKTFGGTLFKEASDVLDIGLRQMMGETRPERPAYSQIPGVKSYMVDPKGQRRWESQFREDNEEFQTWLKSAKNIRDRQGRSALDAEERRILQLEGRIAAINKLFLGKGGINEIRKEITRVTTHKTMSPQEKTRRIDALERRVDGIVKRGLRLSRRLRESLKR